jgi:hypothetical protein
MTYRYRPIVLFLVLLFCSSCSVIFNNRRTAYRQIDEIKSTAMLVRFRSPDKQVAFLKSHNKNKEAQDLLTEVEKENKMIFEAFNAEYDFSDYYFITYDDYQNIRNDDYDQVLLIDKEGNTVNNKRFLENGFHIISFEGAYETQFFSTDASGKRTPGGGSKKVAALAVLDHEFIQLIKPFPYSAGSYMLLKDPRSRKEISDNKTQLVQELNNRLHQFYNNNQSQITKYRGQDKYYHRQ